MYSLSVEKVTTALLAFAFLASFPPPAVVSAAEPTVAEAAAATYNLSEALQVEVKSVLNERVSNGTRIGAIVRLHNRSSRMSLVPAYEVRARTTEGVEYTLQGSALNVTSIQPKETVELSYLTVVSRKDAFSLKRISWLEVNEYVYPKTEKTVLTVLVGPMEWRGDGWGFNTPGSIRPWGEPFRLPSLSPNLRYTPVIAAPQSRAEGSITLVALEVENTGSAKEWIPDFRMGGKAAGKMVQAGRADQQANDLDPGEKRLVYFAIPTGNTALTSLYVLSPEVFIGNAKDEVRYNAGVLQIQLPSGTGSAQNQMVHGMWKDVELSLVGVNAFETGGLGYQTAVATFTLRNKTNRPVQIPQFEAELLSSGGSSYEGAGKTSAVKLAMPNMSYVFQYAFNMPAGKQDASVTINILDSQIAAPYQVPVTAVRAQLRQAAPQNTVSVYPFALTFTDMHGYINMVSETDQVEEARHTYKVDVTVGLQRQENIVVDRSFSTLRFELVDANGSAFDSIDLPLVGSGRLTGGTTTLEFKNVVLAQLEEIFSIHVYEVVQTSDGEVKRLMYSVKQ